MYQSRIWLSLTVVLAMFAVFPVAHAADGEEVFRRGVEACIGTSVSADRLRCYDALVKMLFEREDGGPFPGATDDEQLLLRGLKDCAGMSSGSDRLRCHDNIVEIVLLGEAGGGFTPDRLVEAACGGELLCERHGLAYFFWTPDANVLDVLLSACAKIVGDAITACYRLGLEAYPNLGDADLTRGNRTGLDAARLRAMAVEGLNRCDAQDRQCLKAAIEGVRGRATP